MPFPIHVMLRLATPAVLLALAPLSLAAEPKLAIKAGRGVGGAAIQVERGVVVIDVSSPSGIGQISIANGGQPWPMAAKLRLRYDENRPFTGLEALTLTDSKSRLHTFLGSKSVEVDYLDDVQRQAATTPELKVVKAEGAVEVTLPLDWLADEKDFVVQWVDFHRG